VGGDHGFTEICGERITLRRLTRADLKPLVAYRSDPDVARYQIWDSPYPKAHGERLIHAMLRQHPDTPGEWFQFAVTLRSTGDLIGDCGSKTAADDPRQAEIGYTIGSAHQGNGYGTETARILLSYLFDVRGKHRVTAGCDPRNVASIRVLERVGMRREGHLRQSFWMNGEWADDLLFAILDHEWATQAGQPSAVT
jgi:aminoglycoside 6'-N-acetyltransferase